MNTTFDGALVRVLAHEGGYTNHPADPGGPTNFGITIFDYRKYVLPSATAADVKAMKLADAKKIYLEKYWNAQRCGELEPGVDYAVFDYGINSGVGRSGRVLRRLIGFTDMMSEITPDVVAAANALHAADLVTRICDERIHFLRGLKTWPVFGAGWARRAAEVKSYGVAIAQDLPVVDGASIVPAHGRAIDPDKFAKVRALQTQLAAAGFYEGAIDGDLGPKTVKAFQKSLGLDVDGLVGKITRPLLDAALAPAR
jgi:lysozyme family protein